MAINQVSDWRAQIANLTGLLEAIRDQQKTQFARDLERLRGVSYGELFLTFPTLPTVAVLPSGNGPEQGFAWSLKLAGVALNGNDSVSVWKGDVQSGAAGTPPLAGRLMGYAPAPGAAPAQNVAVITWSSDQGVLKSGQPLFFTTSGAFRIASIFLSYQQVPELEIGKLT